MGTWGRETQSSWYKVKQAPTACSDPPRGPGACVPPALTLELIGSGVPSKGGGTEGTCPCAAQVDKGLVNVEQRNVALGRPCHGSLFGMPPSQWGWRGVRDALEAPVREGGDDSC